MLAPMYPDICPGNDAGSATFIGVRPGELNMNEPFAPDVGSATSLTVPQVDAHEFATYPGSPGAISAAKPSTGAPGINRTQMYVPRGG